jgi:hypothetical protein
MADRSDLLLALRKQTADRAGREKVTWTEIERIVVSGTSDGVSLSRRMNVWKSDAVQRCGGMDVGDSDVPILGYIVHTVAAPTVEGFACTEQYTDSESTFDKAVTRLGGQEGKAERR